MKRISITSSIIIICISLIHISGCKKTDENSTSPSTACLLTRITYGEYEYNGNIADLSYDEDNRLIRRTWIGNPDSDYYTYQYNSDGKLILTTSFLNGIENFKREESWSGNKVTEIDYHYINGSWSQSSFKFVYELDAHDQLICYESYSNSNNGSWELLNYYILEWGGGNTIKSERWSRTNSMPNKNIFSSELFKHNPDEIRDYRSANDDFMKTSFRTYQYDDRNHYYSSIKAIFHGRISKNNGIKEVVTDVSNNDTFENTWSYKYNDKGFPIMKIYGTDTTRYEYNCP